MIPMKWILPFLVATLSVFGRQNLYPPFLSEGTKTPSLVFSANFLYWTPQIDGLEFALLSSPIEQSIYNEKTQDFEVTRTYETRPIEIKGSWQPGLRVLAGYQFDKQGWDALAFWTHFRNHTTTEVFPKEEERLFFLPSVYGESASIGAAKGTWAFRQNSMDIEAGYRMVLNEFFTARPFGGIKGFLVTSESYFQYVLSNPAIPFAILRTDRYLGLGPRLGGNATYEFGRGISLFALASFSLLFGNSTSDLGQNTLQSFETVSSLQVQLGAGWERNFRNYDLGLQALWEQNTYSNILQSPYEFSSFAEMGGDLLLKGFTASCYLNF